MNMIILSHFYIHIIRKNGKAINLKLIFINVNPKKSTKKKIRRTLNKTMTGIFTVILLSVIISFFGQEQAFSTSENKNAGNEKVSNLNFNPLDFGAIPDGNTVFLSTHRLEIAEEVCDRVAIMGGGDLLAMGTLDDLRAQQSDSLESVFLRLVEEAAADGENDVAAASD